MHHTTPYDLIVTTSVISAILLIACKPEWCARQLLRLARISVPIIGGIVVLFLVARFPWTLLLVAIGAVIFRCSSLYDRGRQYLALVEQ